MKNNNGVIIWEGSSQIDGEPIVLLMTGLNYSANQKTGNMLQTYILKQDIHPVMAVRTGDDYSICGNCQHRGQGKEFGKVRTCYVQVDKSPSKVWNMYNQGRYQKLEQMDRTLKMKTLLTMRNRQLRMGSYGDPVAIPFSIWEKLLKRVHSHTGYTSQWRYDFAQPFKGIVQASCNSLDDYLTAKSMGWMTYSTLPVGGEGFKGTMPCVNETSEGTVQCQQCMLCDGKQRDITIHVHGLKHKQTYFEKQLA